MGISDCDNFYSGDKFVPDFHIVLKFFN